MARTRAAMRLDGYVRVSQVRGRAGESFISPTVQREQIERWAALRGVEIIAWHEELDRSGGRTDRPGLMEALDRVDRGETGGLVVAKLDRFARSLSRALDAIKRIDDAGGVFSSVAEGIDPTTPTGKMQLRLMLVLAEFELDRVRENWQTARERAVARGVHIASRTPTGYVRDADGRLEPHPDYAPTITEAFARRAAGASWRELCRLFDARGIVGPYGAARWTTRALSEIIENRVYLGEARSGEYVKASAHEPLVDRATWEAAQGAPLAPSARSRTPALLAGLLRCAGCRYLMRPDSMKRRHGELRGQRVRTYRCHGEHASGRCSESSAVLGSVIEPLVERRFFEEAGRLAAAASTRSAELERADEAATRAEAELARYRDDTRISEALGAERYVEGLRVRRASAEAAHRRVAEARAAAPSFPRRAELEELWPEMEVREKQRLLAAVIDSVFLFRGRVAIEERTVVFLAGEGPTDLPRRGRRVPLRPLDWPVDVPDEAGVAASEEV